MNERDLLSDVLESPADDAPRLAYAAWLKKNGHAERAEFIRVQCKRAQLDEDDPAQAGLAKKENALLKKHGERWKADLPEWGRTGAIFRRGFVARVAIPLDTFVRQGAELVRVTPLETLELGSQDFEGESVRALAQCPHAARLTELNFWFTDINDEGVEALAASPYLTRLRILRLAPDVSPRGIKALAASPQLTGLTTLHLSSHKFGLAGLRALQTAPWKLESLTLANIQLRGKGAAFLAGMSCLASLVRLDVSNCAIDAEGAKALAASPYLANLRVLWLGHNRITAEGVAAVAGSPTLARLRELLLENSRLDDASALALARSPHLSGLKKLVLANNADISETARQELIRRFGKAASVY
jgi:uncharacterized protein (TIGR02996 family)